MDERNVAVIVETSNSYARGVLRGIHEYARTRHGWTLYLTEHGRHEIDESFAGDWEFDGVIARIETDRMARIITAMGVPTVDVSAARLIEGIPWVETDDEAITRLALDHLARLRPAELRLLRRPVLQLVDLAAAELRAHPGASRCHQIVDLQPSRPQGAAGALVDTARSDSYLAEEPAEAGGHLRLLRRVRSAAPRDLPLSRLHGSRGHRRHRRRQ